MFHHSLLSLCTSMHTIPATSDIGWGWVCVSSRVYTGTWVSSRCRLTAELSWSESMRPSDRENRGIKHYHQKRLQCSLLRPHSFLQSSCWFVCSFVVSVRTVGLIESMHFSAPITWRGRRRAEDKKKKKSWGNNKKVRTPPIFHLFKSVFRSSILIHIFIYLCVWEIHQARITLKKIRHLTAALPRRHLTWNRGIWTHMSPSNSAVVCSHRNWHTWCQCGS